MTAAPAAAAAVRAQELLAEIKLRREQDPLIHAYRGLTDLQKSYVHNPAPKRVAEGGNRSGKTWSHIIDRLLQARGLHPTRPWKPLQGWSSWVGWYSTVSYPLIAKMAWPHYKRLLLYPGESEHRLPTRNILAIGWNKKNPQIPNYIKLRREDCALPAEEYFLPYEAGEDAFQSGSVDCLGMDEEGPQSIYRECTLRVLDRNGNMTFSATPLQGAPYLAKLRNQSLTEPKRIFHVRLPTAANPSLTPEALAEIRAELGDDPELVKLRLEGYPLALQGLVYNDMRFRAEHVVDAFEIPRSWTRYRFIDPGFNHCACLWLAVAPKEEYIVAYRDYLGKNRTIEENARAILHQSGGEIYYRTWFDRFYIQKHEAVKGEKMLDLWRKAKVPGFPSRNVGVIPAIQLVWKLLKERAGPNGSYPRFMVFRQSCPNFLRERSSYKWPEAREEGNDAPVENPVKRDDHVMDCWKGAVVSGLRWVPMQTRIAVPGSVRDLINRDRAELDRKRTDGSGL